MGPSGVLREHIADLQTPGWKLEPSLVALLQAWPSALAEQKSAGATSARAGKLRVKAARIVQAEK